LFDAKVDGDLIVTRRISLAECYGNSTV